MAAFRLTKQRQIILEELRRTDTHPTVDELYSKIRKRLPRISLGTVYRNLELLSSGGLIHKVETAGGKKRFDGISQPHYHIHCISCGGLADLAMGPLPDLEKLVLDTGGFRLAGYRLEFTGLCPRCQKINQPAARRSPGRAAANKPG